MPVRFSSISLSIFLTLSAVFLPLQGYSADQCNEVFVSAPEAAGVAEKTPARFGDIKPAFLKKHNNHYTVEVPDQSKVKNQCDLGVCHLESWISDLEESYKARTGENLKISPQYLTSAFWMVSAMQVLANPKADPKSAIIDLGSVPDQSRAFINQVGILPDSAWKGHRDIQNSPQADRMNEYLQNIIARAKSEVARNPKKKDFYIQRGLQQIQDAFTNFLGTEFPSTFKYKGKEYTPQSFADAFLPELKKPITTIYINSSLKAKTMTTPDHTEIVSDIDLVEQVTRELIDKKMNVYLSYDHHSAYVDLKTGIMSISAFNYPKAGAPLTRHQGDIYATEGSGGHAVQITGYDLDPVTNKVIKWHIKNSWGTRVGVKGYLDMYRDYFQRFAQGITFYQEAGVTLPADMAPLPAKDQ